jgi:hypothetical protein
LLLLVNYKWINFILDTLFLGQTFMYIKLKLSLNNVWPWPWRTNYLIFSVYRYKLGVTCMDCFLTWSKQLFEQDILKDWTCLTFLLALYDLDRLVQKLNFCWVALVLLFLYEFDLYVAKKHLWLNRHKIIQVWPWH